ncbi:MAG: glycosyltransferase, partial [Candidatus Eisenbacteria bacterium]|nr:glycosyltransferase [Candidatus Eisenbacteria bacterium]
GGTPEVMQDGRTGWLVPARDPAALARALASALADPTEARRRGEAARVDVLAHRSIAAMARAHETFYESAFARRREDA